MPSHVQFWSTLIDHKLLPFARYFLLVHSCSFLKLLSSTLHLLEEGVTSKLRTGWLCLGLPLYSLNGYVVLNNSKFIVCCIDLCFFLPWDKRLINEQQYYDHVMHFLSTYIFDFTTTPSPPPHALSPKKKNRDFSTFELTFFIFFFLGTIVLLPIFSKFFQK